jgi:predicted amidohydrolase
MDISVFLTQFPVTTSIQDNLKMILSILENTMPGDIAVFPEGSVSGYSHDLGFLKDINQDELTSALDELRDAAQNLKIHIWTGTLIPEDGKWYNAVFGFSPNGGAYQYRKINLATHERGLITPGSDLPVFELETPSGNVKVGVQLCREIRYPEQWGWLARQGAQVLFHHNNAVSSSHYLPVWRSHLISHAVSNQRYVVSSNNAAEKQLCPTIIISPDGSEMVEINSAKCEFTRVELDLTRNSEWYLQQCRQDVVAISVPNQKERRKIIRLLRMEQLKNDWDELQKRSDIFTESNLSARTEALEFIKMIEDLHRVRSNDQDLKELYRQAAVLRNELEQINSGYFTQLRESIQGGDFNRYQLRERFNQYTDYKSSKPGKPHYGYEELDGLIAGIFLSKPAPEETLERQPGMVRYQPTPASVILELIDQVDFAGGVFYDLGSGLGQVIGLVNLLTGVRCVGIEYQPAYCDYASQMAEDLGLMDIAFINSNAQDADFSNGCLFFMFNPFGGRIFASVMKKLQAEALDRKIMLCTYGSCKEPIAELPWLKISDPETIHEFKLAVFQSG